MRSDVPEQPKAFDAPWLVTMAFVVLFIGGATYFATSRLSDNTRAVGKTCAARNEQIAAVNAKFEQLNFIFEAAQRNPGPGSQPPSAELLRLFEAFQKPIPPVSCRDFGR